MRARSFHAQLGQVLVSWLLYLFSLLTRGLILRVEVTGDIFGVSFCLLSLVCVCVCVCKCRYPWGSEKSIRSPLTGVSGNYELPDMGVGNWTWVL
jgi:hypothetical protein